MKKRFLIPAILVMGITATFAFTLQWVSNPAGELVSSYTVYEHTGTTYTVLTTVTPTASPNQQWLIPSPIAPGPHSYAVTATNSRGESPKSADATLPGVPTAPATPTILP